MLTLNINLLFNVINILLLGVLVRLFLFKPIRKILAERQALIDRSISDAETAKSEALALEQQHRNIIQGIEDEKFAVIAAAQKKAAEDYEVILSDAKMQAGNIIVNAQTQAVIRKEEIFRQTKSELAEIIVAAAAKVSGVGNNGDSALYDEFLRKAGRSDGESAG